MIGKNRYKITIFRVLFLFLYIIYLSIKNICFIGMIKYFILFTLISKIIIFLIFLRIKTLFIEFNEMKYY
jgi:hypothetical protein